LTVNAPKWSSHHHLIVTSWAWWVTVVKASDSFSRGRSFDSHQLHWWVRLCASRSRTHASVIKQFIMWHRVCRTPAKLCRLEGNRCFCVALAMRHRLFMSCHGLIEASERGGRAFPLSAAKICLIMSFQLRPSTVPASAEDVSVPAIILLLALLRTLKYSSLLKATVKNSLIDWLIDRSIAWLKIGRAEQGVHLLKLCPKYLERKEGDLGKIRIQRTSTGGLVIQPFQTVAKDVFIWATVKPKRRVNPPPPFNCTFEIVLLTYLYFISLIYQRKERNGADDKWDWRLRRKGGRKGRRGNFAPRPATVSTTLQLLNPCDKRWKIRCLK